MKPGILTNDWLERVVFDSLAWDIFARVLNLSISAGLFFLSYRWLDYLLDAPGVSRWQVAAAGLAVGNILLMAVLGAIRRRPVKRIHGFTQRIVALAGCWLSLLLIASPMDKASSAAIAISLTLVLIGGCGVAWTLCHLGRSGSMMAEARKLKTTGPYRFVRHPLYLFEEMSIVAICVLNPNLFNAVVLAAQITFQILRIRYEERVLEDAFPEYGQFKMTRARLIPGVY